jgi:transposase
LKWLWLSVAKSEISKVSSAEGGWMARSGPLLTEVQWKKIAPLLPKQAKQRKGGRPWIENRRVLEGILWILRSDARWQDLPEKFPHPSTCWRRLRDSEERGVWLHIWRAFLSELNERQQLQWGESFLDGSFAPAKKGAMQSERSSGARGRSGWWQLTARVFLWETTFTLHAQRKSGSRKRRWRRSAEAAAIARADRLFDHTLRS